MTSHRIRILFFCKLNRQFEFTITKSYSMICFKFFSLNKESRKLFGVDDWLFL